VDVIFDLISHDLSIINYFIKKPILHLHTIGVEYLREGSYDEVFVLMKSKKQLQIHIFHGLTLIKLERLTSTQQSF
jgi:hypothetical protein